MFRFIVLIFLFKLPRLIFTQELILVDSINIVADKCIINSNGDIYGVNEDESFLFRINSDGDILKYKLKKFQIENIKILKNDPLKTSFVLPFESRIITFDRQMQIISEEQRPELDPMFSFCFYQSGSKCVFSNYMITVYSKDNEQINQSDQLRLESKMNSCSALFSEGDDIYLWIKDQGIFKYNSYLNFEKALLDKSISSVDIFNNEIYYAIDNKIYKWSTSNLFPAEIFESKDDIKSFSLNREFLIVSNSTMIKQYKFKRI